MAFRLYIVDAIGGGTGLPPPPWTDTTGPRRPKYTHALQPPGGEWWDFGFQPVFLCGVDLTPAQDTAVVANADVIAFPFDLNTTISGGTVNTFKNAQEAKFIPADHITGGMSWREIARIDCGMFLFMRSLFNTLGNVVLFDGTANETLNVQFGSTPLNIQQGILGAAALSNFSTSFITSTTQVRAVLKGFADQSLQQTFIIGGTVI